MDRRRSRGPDGSDRLVPGTTEEREPIRSPWLFAVAALLIVAGTPLWYPAGTIEPIVAGVPVWFAVAVVTSVGLSALTCWACLRAWNIAEPFEESGGDLTRGTDAGEA